MNEKKKEGKFQNLKQRCQFWRLLKNLIIRANQKFSFLKRVSIKTSHKCCWNAKSHPTAKGRKQLNRWMVWIGQDAINQRTAESSYKYVWCFFCFVRPSQVTEGMYMYTSSVSEQAKHKIIRTWSRQWYLVLSWFKVSNPLCYDLLNWPDFVRSRPIISFRIKTPLLLLLLKEVKVCQTNIWHVNLNLKSVFAWPFFNLHFPFD